jgi:hypothetical protein
MKQSKNIYILRIIKESENEMLIFKNHGFLMHDKINFPHKILKSLCQYIKRSIR